MTQQPNYAAQSLQNTQPSQSQLMSLQHTEPNYAAQGLNNAYPSSVTVNVIVRQETEADRFWRSADAWGKAISCMWDARIRAEQAKGNPFFANVETQEQYVEACRLTEKKKRRDLGFWKYHFGS